MYSLDRKPNKNQSFYHIPHLPASLSTKGNCQELFNIKTKNVLQKLSAIKEPKEKINEPITPDKVLLGLIFVIFFHLKIFPNTYPPISELIVKIIIQINNIRDDEVSFLR